MNQLHLQFKKAAGGGVGGLDLHLEHEGDPFMCVSSTLTKETPPCSLLPTPPPLPPTRQLASRGIK